MGREEKGESDIRATGAARSQEIFKQRVQRASQSQEQLQQVVEARRVKRRILNSKVCHGDATRSEEILRGSFVVVSLEYSDDTIGEMTVILSVIMKQIWQNFMQLRTSSKLG